MEVVSPTQSWSHGLEVYMRCLGKWILVAAIAYLGTSTDSVHSRELNTEFTAAEAQGDSCLVVVPGDVNQTGTVTSADIIYLVNYCFIQGPEPEPCTYAGDVNCNATVTTADVIGLVNYVFKSGEAPCDICAAEQPFDCVQGQ